MQQKLTFFALSALHLAKTTLSDQALNGWSINCKINSDGGNYGPAFLLENPKNNDLLWSSFGVRGAGIYGNGPFDNNFSVGNFCENANNSTSKTLVDSSYLSWPNEIGWVPEEVFGKKNLIHIPEGFAQPSSYDGCIAIADMNKADDQTLSDSDLFIISGGCFDNNHSADNHYTKYYYHFAKWFDMDGDGDLDLLTARSSSKYNPTDVDSSQLVWFQNPGNQTFDPKNSPWNTINIPQAENISDTYFDVFENPNNGNIVIITGGFSSKKLILLEGPKNQNQSPKYSLSCKVIVEKGKNFTSWSNSNSMFIFFIYNIFLL